MSAPAAPPPEPLSPREIEKLRAFLRADDALRDAAERDPRVAMLVETCQRLLATIDRGAGGAERATGRRAEQEAELSLRRSLLQQGLPPPGLLPGPDRSRR
jgi:hypothetical protein